MHATPSAHVSTSRPSDREPVRPPSGPSQADDRTDAEAGDAASEECPEEAGYGYGV